MRTPMILVVCLLACPTVSMATVIDVEGFPPAFEESPLGSIEAPWAVGAGVGCPNDNTQVYEGEQSALVSIGTNVNWNNVDLGEEGWYEFMFYDDMVDVGNPDVGKNVRAGLHYQAGPYHAPRLGGPAPRRETAQSPESVQSRLTGARRSRIRAISSGCSERHFSFFGADPPVLCFFSFARSITAADEGDSRSSQKSMILR